MLVRIYITVGVLLIYSLLFNGYIFELTHQTVLTAGGVRILYTSLTMGMVSFFLMDRFAGYVNYLHKQFSYLCMASVYSNWVLIIMIHLSIIQGTICFYLFNGLIFANTLIIFTCMRRHGINN